MTFTDKAGNKYQFNSFVEFATWYFSFSYKKLSFYFDKSELTRMFMTIEEDDFIEEKYLTNGLTNQVL